MSIIMKTVKVSDKGQIAIPSEIQRMTGIKKGDTIILTIKDDKILLKKVDDILSKMTYDFKDMEHYAEESLEEFWKDEPKGMWEKYLEPRSKQKRK
jgi:AbrB family looped-hinge helix DNA binding protein